MILITSEYIFLLPSWGIEPQLSNADAGTRRPQVRTRPSKKINTKKKPLSTNLLKEACKKSWRRPTLPRVCSTIGAVGLNFSVRNGKR